MDRRAWHPIVHRVQRVRHDWACTNAYIDSHLSFWLLLQVFRIYEMNKSYFAISFCNVHLDGLLFPITIIMLQWMSQKYSSENICKPPWNKFQVVQILSCRAYIFYIVISSATLLSNGTVISPVTRRGPRTHILKAEKKCYIIEDLGGREIVLQSTFVSIIYTVDLLIKWSSTIEYPHYGKNTHALISCKLNNQYETTS